MWKQVANWHYEVSDTGEVRNTRTGHVLKSFWHGPKYKRYLTVNLSHEGTMYVRRIHVLVLEAFRGPRPPAMLGLHRDDDSSNNALQNLFWGTSKTNNRMVRVRQDRKVNRATAKEIQRRRGAGERGVSLAREFNISQQRVCDIYKGRAVI